MTPDIADSLGLKKAEGALVAEPHLVFSVQPGNETSGIAIAPAVTVAVQDINGNTVTTATNPVTLALGGGTYEIKPFATLTILDGETIASGELLMDPNSSLVAEGGLQLDRGTCLENGGSASVTGLAEFLSGSGTVAGGTFSAGTLTVDGGTNA